MKTSLSLLLIAAATAAFAQNGDFPRRDDFPQRGGPRVEGQYDALQRDGTVHRILRLERDGRVEMVVEFRRKNDDNPREGWIRMNDRDVDRYGFLAERAATGQTVRLRGRWALRDDRLTLRFDDGRGDRRDRDRLPDEVELKRNGGGWILDRNTRAFGNDKITFRPDDGWGGGGGGRDPERPNYGFFYINRDRVRIDDINLVEGQTNRLEIRADGRRIDIPGELRRRGDTATLRIFPNRDDSGEFQITLRGSRVISITGVGTYNNRRFDFNRK